MRLGGVVPGRSQGSWMLIHPTETRTSGRIKRYALSSDFALVEVDYMVYCKRAQTTPLFVEEEIPCPNVFLGFPKGRVLSTITLAFSRVSDFPEE